MNLIRFYNKILRLMIPSLFQSMNILDSYNLSVWMNKIYCLKEIYSKILIKFKKKLGGKKIRVKKRNQSLLVQLKNLSCPP